MWTSNPAPARPDEHMTAEQRKDTCHLRQFEMAAAIQQSLLSAVTRTAGSTGTRTMPAGSLPSQGEELSRIFPGTADQVAEVRRFVRAELGGHAS